MMDVNRDGSHAVIASRSRTSSLHTFLPAEQKDIQVQPLAQGSFQNGAKGVHFHPAGQRNLVTESTDWVSIVDVSSQEVTCGVQISSDGVNLRDAVWDPSGDGFIAISHEPNKGAHFVDVKYPCAHQQNVSKLTGRPDHGSGLIDRSGQQAHFSRPHHMHVLSNGSLLASDIENQVLRVIRLEPGARGYTWTVAYRNLFMDAPPSRATYPILSTFDSEWSLVGEDLGIRMIKNSRFDDMSTACTAVGGALCSAETMQAMATDAAVLPGGSLHDHRDDLDGGVWTSTSCNSCWHSTPFDSSTGCGALLRSSTAPATTTASEAGAPM